MNPQRPAVEEQIARWLDQEAPGEPPDRVLEAAFARTRAMPQERLPLWGRIVVSRRAALLVALLVLATSLVGFVAGGGRLVLMTVPAPPPDRLDLIRAAGVLRVAVSLDFPQSTTRAGTLDGFDVDLAREIGRRLGLDVAIVGVRTANLPLDRERWDLALPAAADWSIDSAAFAVTAPSYAWRRLVVVPAGSGATSLDDVKGQPVCAVAGDAGQRWLLGTYAAPASGRTPAQPIPSSLVLRSSDEDCLAVMAGGDVLAVVTSTLTSSQVAARSGVRAIEGGPPPEPRAAIVDRAGPDPAALEAAVEQAIGVMRRDGTLARLSLVRFGTDLTVP